MSFIVKNTTFPSFLDLLAPYSCRGCGAIGGALCQRCKNNIILESTNYCPNCKMANPTGKCSKCKCLPPTFVVGGRTELIGKLVYDLKFNSMRVLARPIAEILHAVLPNIDGRVDIVPLPTIRRHIRERGLDHTRVIAKELARIRGVNYRVSPILIRANNTVQVGANRKERMSQAASAYNVRMGVELDPCVTYVIFDDIWTTGASMKNAIKIMRNLGAKKIIVVLLAVSRVDEK